MTTHHSTPNIPPPLVAGTAMTLIPMPPDEFMHQIESVIARRVDEALAACISRVTQTFPDVTDERSSPLTVPQIMKRYHLGRQTVIQAIEAGEIRATERRMRGGHLGYVVEQEAADKLWG